MTEPIKVSLPATETLTMTSKVSGKNYRLSIALPFHYVDDTFKMAPFDEPLTTWPVIYLLDGDWLFGMVTDIVRMMAWFGRTTDAIIVGIGYPEEENLKETWHKAVVRRTQELTPFKSQTSDQFNSEWLKHEVKTGGGAEFYQFMSDKLIPLIDTKYRADPSKRILVGHSHGGLFTLFAMFQNPALFSDFISSSPSLHFAEEGMFAIEKEYAKQHKELPTQLYLSIGDLETGVDESGLIDLYRFAAILEDRKYQGFSLLKHVFLEKNHTEVIAPAIQDGLNMALRK